MTGAGDWTSRKLTSGCPARKPATRPVTVRSVSAATATVPWASPAASRSSCWAWSSSPSALPTRVQEHRAEPVEPDPPPCRSKSGTPSSASRRAIDRLSAGWATCSSAAARLTCWRPGDGLEVAKLKQVHPLNALKHKYFGNWSWTA